MNNKKQQISTIKLYWYNNRVYYDNTYIKDTYIINELISIGFDFETIKHSNKNHIIPIDIYNHMIKLLINHKDFNKKYQQLQQRNAFIDIIIERGL